MANSRSVMVQPLRFEAVPKPLPPDPLPCQERGSKTEDPSSLPLSWQGRGSGGGVLEPRLNLGIVNRGVFFFQPDHQHVAAVAALLPLLALRQLVQRRVALG